MYFLDETAKCSQKKDVVPVKEIKPIVGQDLASVTIFSPQNGRLKSTRHVETSLITLNHIQPLPRYTDWTPIPYNIRENESKYLTNIPYLGDELIDRDSNYLQDVLGLYDWKIEEDAHTKKIDDEVFFSLITELMTLEMLKGPEIFNCNEDTTESNSKTAVVVPQDSCKPQTILSQSVENLPSANLISALRKSLPMIGSEQEVVERYLTLFMSSHPNTQNYYCFILYCNF